MGISPEIRTTGEWSGYLKPMFDTVAGKFEKGPYLPKDESRNSWETRTRKFFDTKLGDWQTSTTQAFNRPEARIAIYGDGAILRVEASLPKLLYGNNLATVCDAELPLKRLHEFVSDHVSGEIPELGLRYAGLLRRLETGTMENLKHVTSRSTSYKDKGELSRLGLWPPSAGPVSLPALAMPPLEELLSEQIVLMPTSPTLIDCADSSGQIESAA